MKAVLLSAVFALTGGAGALMAQGTPDTSAARPAIFSPRTVSLPGTHESFNGFSEEGLLVFTRCRSDFTGCEILEASPRGGEWHVEGRAPFARGGTVSGATVRRGPAVTFHTTPKHPGEGAGADWKLWEALRGGATWSRRRLPAPVNSEARECCAAPSAPGSLYFSSDRAGSWQIFHASAGLDGVWKVVKLPPEVNSSAAGQWPSQADDGSGLLLFSSIRPAGPGGDDIYVCFRQAGRWTPPRPLPAPVNSDAFEDGARLSPDGRLLFFSSTRPTAAGDRSSNIYTIEVGSLLRP